jgi:acyl-lipid omega-6 desaturase (Delta-12 desaturase)
MHGLDGSPEKSVPGESVAGESVPGESVPGESVPGETLLRERAGIRYHGGAVAYACFAWAAGFAGLFSKSGILNTAATLLLAHGMIIAAYLVHECAHNNVFRRHSHNARLGRAMTWLCGACYGTYEDIRYKHFRHHVDNDDVVWFDADAWFERHGATTRAIRILEFLYVPAQELLMHGIMAVTSFVIPARRQQRARNLRVLAIRGGAFLVMLVWATKAALLYALAYLLMLHVLRFMDMLQHDYPYSLTLFSGSRSPHRGDARWEQEHTFSNPLSLRFPIVNWLVLNFGYHNAHHHEMNLPWYRLPAMHREITGDDPERVIPLRAQLRLYHANRVRRVFNPQPAGYPKGTEYLVAARSGTGPVGGNAASFLTAF